MVNYNLITDLDADGQELEAEVQKLLGEAGSDDQLSGLVQQQTEEFRPGTILKGKIVGRTGDAFVVDVGLKSEGLVPREEWEDPSSVDIGDEIQVWLENVESDTGHIILSKRKADRIINWHRICTEKKEGDEVEGRVMRKIKGGLLVDIGYPVFLPASQVDIRRPGDISGYIGRSIRAKILKIDADRRNIVISRRKLLEEERATAKEKLMAELEVGQVRKGIVKNIADFGAFVDLGGIDGLLHITDMSWDRITHPSEILKIDQEIEVKILNIDHEKEKIALGLKQLRVNPWEEVEAKYPPGTRLKGEVVNLVNYGAFVKIAPGVEGLVHISEMSWTRRISHPSELLSVGDEIEVVVLEINKDKQEISLGIKQTQPNPWEHVAEKYPPNTRIKGRVRNLTNYGAFIEIEEGIDGLLHVSDMSWTKKIGHPSEVVKKGEEIECVVLKVEQDKQRIALGLKQLQEDPWARAVPENYIPGQIVEGTVTKITNFGVFVELEQDLEGLLHVSELADHKVEDPHTEVKIGDKILVKILRVDQHERKIGLSKKRAEWSVEQEAESAAADVPKERRGGLDTDLGGGLIAPGRAELPTTEEPAPAEAASPEPSGSEDAAEESAPTGESADASPEAVAEGEASSPETPEQPDASS
ncbi:MAG: 30S ribosomal protein S1 [Planctomycetota bacterium]|nr:MAG: 30S ribosomal protein S1 [Planctomycetota bacterium]